MGAFIPEEIRSKLREQRSILDKLYPDIHERDPAFYQFASIEKELPEWSKTINNALFWRQDWRNKKVDPEATYPETEKFVQFVISRINK